jgi:hypothetical protein
MKAVFLVVFVFYFASGQLPDSPCPSVFTYEYDYAAKRWAGQIRVHSPPSGKAQIDCNFTLAAVLKNVSFIEQLEKVTQNKSSPSFRRKISVQLRWWEPPQRFTNRWTMEMV